LLCLCSINMACRSGAWQIWQPRPSTKNVVRPAIVIFAIIITTTTTTPPPPPPPHPPQKRHI
jgi:hypothetical protein